MNRKDVIVLSELYYPEDISTAYFLTGIAEALATEYTVSVITGPATKNFSKYEAPSNEVRNGVHIKRCLGTCFNKNSILGRVVNAVTRCIALFWAALFKADRNAIVLVVTNPPILPWIAALIYFFRATPFILLIQDVYPEILEITGICRKDSLLFRVIDFINKLTLKHARSYVVLGRDMQSIVIDKIGADIREKVYLITNWSDERIKPLAQHEVQQQKSQFGMSNKFIVMVTGNLGRTHGVECLASAATLLREHDGIRFVIMGQGAKKKWLEQYVSQHKLMNISLVPPCEWSELNSWLNISDVAVIPFVKSMFGLSVPSRLYNHMAVGRPIIGVTDSNSELALTINEQNIGWVVEPEDSQKLADTILFAQSNRVLCAEMGERAIALNQAKYTQTKVVQAYCHLLQDTFRRGAVA